MNSQTAQVEDLQLVTYPSAVNCTDFFIRFTLTEWALRPLQDEATHAAAHFVADVVHRANPREPGFITVRLQVRADHLLVEVEDDQSTQPPAASPRLADLRTGVVARGGRGKVAWCEIPLPNGVSASRVALPRRDGRRSLVQEQIPGDGPVVDPDLAQRVLTGLNRFSHDGS
ncbi:ATP-binding protein [Amycolatopsis palatopharyngis]|uniref:ATP-binding protein n=1 Tax=Amycolatopsis palatopharyngis TaxID=187982 RepID=UPI000E228457|nr:ATP-binding protein [Amycolatopsis palatopharyngis]